MDTKKINVIDQRRVADAKANSEMRKQNLCLCREIVFDSEVHHGGSTS
jgi:hypothetical protein